MITSKNIDEVLKKKYFEEIKEFFKKNRSGEERVKYIRDLYGTGGWYIPQKGDFIHRIDYDFSGIEFRKRSVGREEEKLKMNWSKIAMRLQNIIESENQLSLF